MKVTTKTHWTLLAALALVGAAVASATPIVYNASFEEPFTPDQIWEPDLASQGGAGWDFYPGAFHAGIVRQDHLNFAPGLYADDGEQFGSLWCGGDEIAQYISGFTIGETYTVSWAEAGRLNYVGDLWVLMDDVTIMAAHPITNTDTFITQSVEFTATAEVHRLRFFHAGAWDEMIHIDDVQVTPEPSAMTLLAAGALLLMRRR